MKVFVSTYPFGLVNEEPLEMLRKKNIHVELNPYKRKVSEDELKNHLQDKDGLIAGTEKLGKNVLDCAPNLKIIARVGIGLDGIDFDEIKRRRILLTYTPDAVSQAVAELTIANMLNLARLIPQIHMNMKSGQWNRTIGFEIAGKKVGIIGFGRVGQRVARMLQGFSCEILANDITPDEEIGSILKVYFCSKEEIYKTADIITLHVPKTPLTVNLIDDKVLSSMKETACLINTSRGGIINENDLYNALKGKTISAAAIDVYEIEPYISGSLCELDNIVLTSHNGSCSKEARYLMEFGAAQEIALFHDHQPPHSPVPDETFLAERASKVIPINAEWHVIADQSEENKNDRYRIYRKRWGQYPTHSIVGESPLNIDIELVRNELPSEMKYFDLFFSPPSKTSRFMDVSLFKQIADELKGFTEPFALKLGFRGDSLGHPHLIEILNIVTGIGAVETLLSTKGKELSDFLIQILIDNKLDVLNMLIEDDNEKLREELCQKIDRIRKYRALKNVRNPKIRIFTESNIENIEKINEFKRFWGHWADVLVIVDEEISSSSKIDDSINIQWSCSRLWQRIMITVDGSILACNYDIYEKSRIGKFPFHSIKEAWQNPFMQSIRDKHARNRSHEIEACRGCPFRNTEMQKLR